MKQYIYNSIHSCHLSLKIEDVSREFSFHNGQSYDLPEEDIVVRRMVAQGLLTPMEVAISKKPDNKKNNI